jgi:hypothetical protein
MADAPDPRKPKDLDFEWDDDSYTGPDLVAPDKESKPASPWEKPRPLSADETERLGAKFTPSWPTADSASAAGKPAPTPVGPAKRTTPPGGFSPPPPHPPMGFPSPRPPVASDDETAAALPTPPVTAPSEEPAGESTEPEPRAGPGETPEELPPPRAPMDTAPSLRRRLRLRRAAAGTPAMASQESADRPTFARQWGSFLLAAGIGAALVFGVVKLTQGPAKKPAVADEASATAPAASSKATVPPESPQPMPLESIPVPVDSLPAETPTTASQGENPAISVDELEPEGATGEAMNATGTAARQAAKRAATRPKRRRAPARKHAPASGSKGKTGTIVRETPF